MASAGECAHDLAWSMNPQTKHPAVPAGGGNASRPSPDQLFEAAIDLVSSGSAYKSTARRFSLCTADAEDAYQRGLEILMTKAPTSDLAQLRPWLHTVIKHEALALRRQRERILPGSDDPAGALGGAGNGPSPEEQASERERARRTAEALGQLKSSELQCLLLKALGYSYQEISNRTGFSWTKVNRSLTEGRRRFFDRFAQIEAGRRCERFQPLLSAASDGEASRDDERELRAHLRGCPGCRALLRDYRSIPAQLAELLPPAVLVPLAQKGSWWSRLYEALAVGTADRAGAVGYKVQQAGELLSAQKTTAVVASTAALAGGVAVQERGSHERGAHRQQATSEVRQQPAPAGGELSPPTSTAPPAPPQPAPANEIPGSTTNGEGAPDQAGEFSPEPPAGSEKQERPLEFAGGPESAVGSQATAASGRPASGSEFGP
jgi:RNA polymerase sigma factor (sigma-70 family)